MTVALDNASGQPADEGALVSLADYVMRSMRVDPARELSVQLVDEAEMTRLHVDFMGEDGPTDVLAFPMDDDVMDPIDDEMPSLLGDVVLCPSIAKTQGALAGHGMQDELHLLCAHGILHLLGYDHHDPESEREMFGLQARLLADWSSSRTLGRR